MSTIDSLGRHNLNLICTGLYKEQAKQFQNWVFNDVLPSIRKTGTYLTPKQQFLLDILDSKDEVGYVKPLENKADVYDAIEHLLYGKHSSDY